MNKEQILEHLKRRCDLYWKQIKVLEREEGLSKYQRRKQGLLLKTIRAEKWYMISRARYIEELLSDISIWDKVTDEEFVDLEEEDATT
jgi:hypothetical protein